MKGEQGLGLQEMQLQEMCMLPSLQAADLAEKSPERAVRVASCEFLHATILWMVGTNARR